MSDILSASRPDASLDQQVAARRDPEWLGTRGQVLFAAPATP
ncbi:hypothetical protein [Massilia violaceinigra]|nr:hypothetical protein [Massilia violaceinigra]